MKKKDIEFRKFKNDDGEIEEFVVFIIHGHSKEWEKINDFIREKLKFKTIVSVTQFKGGSILQKIKKTIWNQCDCAVAILSPDDKLENGENYARQNVIYEMGYCQGFWDHYYWEDEELEPVIPIKEKSVEINSDLNGSEVLEYEVGKINSVFKKLSATLEYIYNYLNNSDFKLVAIKDKAASNDLIIIQKYLADRKLSFISFEKLEENVHPKFNEKYLMKLIEKLPDKIRRAKIKNGMLGIKLLK